MKEGYTRRECLKKGVALTLRTLAGGFTVYSLVRLLSDESREEFTPLTNNLFLEYDRTYAEERLKVVNKKLEATYNFMWDDNNIQLNVAARELNQLISEGAIYFQAFSVGVFRPEYWGSYPSPMESGWRIHVGDELPDRLLTDLSPQELAVFAYYGVEFLKLAKKNESFSAVERARQFQELDDLAWENALLNVYRPFSSQIKDTFLKSLWEKYQKCRDAIDFNICWAKVPKTSLLYSR
ncbi:hypothetical protein A2165_02880 [Candidatus Curtissbacteria bacterium RBG_13_40_7]|uniref:Uncharacterized protein n=1 Tax=Candidatus Curtissbacteria bacterium RBG_13_40_7 TaxID=1797706 RepID=A0A1F5FX15_9BACT|nr:MAG: hypothetical protein A2165_02880 [Candidatus Curtissbacteria bacterium RBG_13_40_7]